MRNDKTNKSMLVASLLSMHEAEGMVVKHPAVHAAYVRWMESSSTDVYQLLFDIIRVLYRTEEEYREALEKVHEQYGSPTKRL